MRDDQVCIAVAAVVVGVAAATTDIAPIITAGAAAVVGGAISMALGEYVSVASARDSQTALIAKERRELAEMPEQELAELASIYQAKGLTPETAQKVAEELTAHDALGAHLEAELHIDENEVLKPWQAAVALGGNVRVGLEDNLFLDRGVLATNAQLVERVIGIVTRMGARVLTPQQARNKLKLRGADV